MKKIIIAMAAMFMFAAGLQAQKIAFVSTQKVIDTLPQKDSAEKELSQYAALYQNQLAEMEQELSAKQMELEKEANTPGVSQIRLELLQNNLKKLYEQYQLTEATMNNDLNAKRSELIAPILKEIKDAVAIVAKSKGYTSALDNSTEMVLFMSNSADDITDMVIKHMLGGAATVAPKK